MEAARKRGKSQLIIVLGVASRGRDAKEKAPPGGVSGPTCGERRFSVVVGQEGFEFGEKDFELCLLRDVEPVEVGR